MGSPKLERKLAASIRLAFHAEPTPHRAPTTRRTPPMWITASAVIGLLVVISVAFWGFKNKTPQPQPLPIPNVEQTVAQSLTTASGGLASFPARIARGKPSIAVLPFNNISDDPK